MNPLFIMWSSMALALGAVLAATQTSGAASWVLLALAFALITASLVQMVKVGRVFVRIIAELTPDEAQRLIMTRDLPGVAAALRERMENAEARAHRMEQQTLALMDTNTALAETRRRVTRMERNARAAEARMRAIFDAVHDAIVVVDRDGQVIDCNASASWLGACEQLRRASLVDTIIAPNYRDAWRKRLAGDGARTDVATAHHDIEVVTSAGRAVPCTVYAVQLAKPAGGWVAVIRDLSEARRMETELRQAQKLEAVGRLASGIAHELNTPIQFIGDNCSFLGDAFTDMGGLIDVYRAMLEEPPADAAARVREAEDRADLDYLRDQIPKSVARCLDGVKRVADIVRAMKEFAHPSHKEMIDADLNAAIRSTATVAHNAVKYVADVKLELGELPAVPCLLGELNQVFLNLLVNAAHAIEDKEGQGGKRGIIQVTTRVQGDNVVVSISDSGCGIPETIRQQIFDPFFTTKEVGRGTGQGLAIARNIVVEKHQGLITLESEVGRGTTFHIHLPLKRATPAKEQAA